MWWWIAIAVSGELAGLTPLPPVDRHTSDADLAPFAPVIAGAELVGLGESLHACGGYLEAKARLVRWLVEVQGFRVVAIESPWTRARPAQAWVARGEGSADLAMRSVFPAFWDSQTLEMLAWLRTWNGAHPDDPVHFVGFDVQDDADELALFLASEGLSEVGIDACRDGACDVPADRPWVQLAVDAFPIREALDRASGWDPVSYRQYANVRDLGMADTLLRIRELVAPGARTVVLAHNAHLMRRGSAIRWVDTGEHLAERLGDRWAAIGLVATRVDTMGQGWRLHDGRRDVEARIAEAVDTESALLVPADAGWLEGRWRVGGDQVVPAEQYDAVLFLDHARASDATLFDAAPWAEAQAMDLLGGEAMFDLVAVHRTAPDEVERDRLWSAYVAWLANFGYGPSRDPRGGPTRRAQSFVTAKGAQGSLELRWELGEWRMEVWADRSPWQPIHADR